MKKQFKQLMKGWGILFALPFMLTSCGGTLDDIIGESSNPTTNPSLSLDKTALPMNYGAADVTLVATVTASDATVTWSSSDDAVVTVDATGKVHAKKTGTATITAKAGTLKATCDVTVSIGLATPLTFEAEADGVTIKFNDDWDNYVAPNVQYSTDDGATWKDDLTIAGVSLSAAGDKVLFRGSNSEYSSNGCHFKVSDNYKIYGNIMSLVNKDDFATNYDVLTADGTFAELFLNNAKLTDASNLILPATTLSEGCYQSMFYGCTSLTTAPELPAETMKESCYGLMFHGCKALTAAPVLPAKTLAKKCYQSMFEGCTALTTAPELPATTLKDENNADANDCYALMFYGCKSLTTSPILPAATLVLDCYYHMFFECTKLASVTCLATNISTTCLTGWLEDAGTDVTSPKLHILTTGAPDDATWNLPSNPTTWQIVRDQ
jgi:hypothetical protein